MSPICSCSSARIRVTPKRYPRRIQPVSRNHHQVEKLVSTPASQPADPPAVDVITHRCLFAKANEFGFDVHSSHIHPSLGYGVNQQIAYTQQDNLLVERPER